MISNEFLLKGFRKILGKYGEGISAAEYDKLNDQNKPAGRTLRRRFGSWLKAKGIALGRDIITPPKILLLDIETAMMEVYVWGLYKQAIPPSNIINDWFCLGWSAKWLFDSKMMSDILAPKEAVDKNDKRIVDSMWKLMDEADIIIAHNGDNFDLRKLNARFITHGLTTPMPYRSIDTMKVSKKNFALPSYSLSYMCSLFGLPGKYKSEYGLWKRCVKGNKSALKEMNRYNQQDVVMLEELYLKLRPWIKSHPNIGTYVDTEDTVCPNCGSSKLDWRGYYHTPAGRYRAFRCECGAIGRSRYSDLSKEERKKLVISVAR